MSIDMFKYVDQPPYKDRVVGLNTFDWGFISTAKVNDGRKLFETAVKHQDFNDGEMVIVACYDTKKEAQTGHDKWITKMENPPKELIDIANSEISQFIGEETFKRKVRINIIKYARANKSVTDTASYIEIDKVYKVTDMREDGGPIAFTISSDQLCMGDDGVDAECREHNCNHLHGGNWDLFEDLPK